MKLLIKPLSVNDCWQGRRFKTDEYKKYEREVLFLLPAFKLPNPPYQIELTFGLSSVLSDIDNPVKPFVDILQKKYLFNDKHIHRAVINKQLVTKGNEFIDFEIKPYAETH